MRAAVPDPHAALRRAAAALLLLAGWLPLLGCKPEPPSEPPAPPRPNVLLISIDTLRADALGSYGQSLPTSPNLDALASAGVVFEDCISSAPSTLPSHASIMTGKQPNVHGARDNTGYVLTADHVTLAEVLRAHGYRTAAEVAAAVIGRRTLLNQGFDRYRDLEFPDVAKLQLEVDGEILTIPERPASDITSRGIEFLQTAADQPFFLWLHYYDPHVIYGPPVAFTQLLPDSPYHAEVRYVDAEIGRLLAALRQYQLADRTLVVVTSDHGEGLGEHQETTHSYFVYDTTMRVPLIFWAPRLIPEPRRVRDLVRLIDVAPTILDLVGLPPPAEIQGVSLRPLVEGREASLGLIAYGETLVPTITFDASPLRFVRTGDWKYIHKVAPELYDVGADPGELRNRAAEQPERVLRLREDLRRLVESAPPTSGDARTDLDPIAAAHLQALGYVTPSTRPEPAVLDSLEVSGVDPSALALDVTRLTEAWGQHKAGKPERALEMFLALHQRHPRSIAVLDGVIGSLRLLGRRDEMIEYLRKGVALGTAGAAYYSDLGVLLAEDGEHEEAERLLRRALELEPCPIVAWVHLSNLLHAQGRYALQLETLEQASARCPDSPDLRNDLAYALATSPDDALRDGARALRLAQQAVSEGGGNPSYLDTLACAFAETGDFASALSTLDRALSMIEGRDEYDAMREALLGHRAVLQEQRPIRDQAPTSATAANQVG